MRRLPLLVVLLLGPGRPAAADPAGDQAYIKRLGEHLKELQRTAALFEQQRRSLELVKFTFASLELPLADPSSSPEQLVRRLLARSFPALQLTMRRLPAQAPPEVEVWKWRCSLAGALEDLRGATRLLLRKGLFVRPAPGEEVTLTLEAGRRRGGLTFVGHHLRIREAPPAKLAAMPAGPDLLAARTDALGRELRRLQGEVTALRQRVQDIMTFEARVEAMRFVIKHLRDLAERGRDPFERLGPVLALELVRLERLVDGGAEVAIDAGLPSESARAAATRWLQRRGRGAMRYRFAKLAVVPAAPSGGAALQPPSSTEGAGPRCALRLAGARAIDLLAATGAAAAVAVGPQREVSGELPQGALGRAVEAGLASLGLALLEDGEARLAVPRDAAPRSRRSLADSARASGERLELHLASSTIAEVLAGLARGTRRSIEAPERVLASGVRLALIGRRALGGWLRLLGATHGLRLAVSAAGWQLRPPGQTVAPLTAVSRRGPASPPAVAPLAELRPRVLLVCGGAARAIVAAPAGPPAIVRAGARLGRHGRVTRVDRQGVTVRWSEAGITASVLLPW